MNNVENFSQLVSMSEVYINIQSFISSCIIFKIVYFWLFFSKEELHELLENSGNAKQLWEALNLPQNVGKQSEQGASKKGKKWKGKTWKK